MGLCPIFSPRICLEHQTGGHHPESPARLRAIHDRVTRLEPGALRESGPAPLTAIERVHPTRYLEELARIGAAGGGPLDPDTVMGPVSWTAALHGVGAVLDAVRCALEGTPAFAAIRPPGHHALLDRPMGFCLVSNAVIGAREAQALGADRVLILDWDVHHGNGTQALIEQDPSIRFVSMHQWPHWPFTGAADERGVGNVTNVPMRAGLPPERYQEAFWDAVLAATTGWSPELILVSAGFDSMQGDPLGGFTLEPEHYAEWTRRLRDRFPNTPLAMTLEGGYAPARLADGVVAVAGVLGTAGRRDG